MWLRYWIQDVQLHLLMPWLKESFNADSCVCQALRLNILCFSHDYISTKFLPNLSSLVDCILVSIYSANLALLSNPISPLNRFYYTFMVLPIVACYLLYQHSFTSFFPYILYYSPTNFFDNYPIIRLILIVKSSPVFSLNLR